MSAPDTRPARRTFAIYLPAYNAAKTLPAVLDRLPPALAAAAVVVLVVDNHSTDDTEAVALAHGARLGLANLRVLRTPRNVGYGGSQQLAYRTCLDLGVDVVAMVHADGQYAPELLPDLLAPVLAGEADLVFGSRITGDPRKGGMPLHRFLGNRVLTWAQNRLLGSDLSEFHSGYRVYATDVLATLPFERLADDYVFDTEILIALLHAGGRIREQTIPTHYGDEENHVHIWRYGVQVLQTTSAYALYRAGGLRRGRWTDILEGDGRARAEAHAALRQALRVDGVDPASASSPPGPASMRPIPSTNVTDGDHQGGAGR